MSERKISPEELAIVALLEPQAQAAYHEGVGIQASDTLGPASAMSIAISLKRLADAAQTVASCVSEGDAGPSFNTWKNGGQP